jgi:hypothetical protein
MILPMNTHLIEMGIVAIYKTSVELMGIYKATYNFCKNKFDFLGLDDS